MKIKKLIGKEFYILNNKLEPNLKKKDWYEITRRSNEKNVALRKVGTSKILEIPTKSFYEGRVAGYYLFLDEMV